MVHNARFGWPLETESDLLIVKAIGRGAGICPGKFDPSQGLQVFRTPLNQQDPCIPRPVLVAYIFVIVFVIVLTATRLMLRAFVRNPKLGLGDWTIIPAISSFDVYFRAQIMMHIKARLDTIQKRIPLSRGVGSKKGM